MKIKLERKEGEEDPKNRRSYDQLYINNHNIYIEDMGYKEVEIDVTVNEHFGMVSPHVHQRIGHKF